MVEPTIIIGGDIGRHNTAGPETRKRLRAGKQYRDLSTVIVVPTRDMIPARAVENWLGLMTPMNNKVVRIFVAGMEVGDAYNQAVHLILNHPELSTWKYMLTLESDNLPPPDGLLKLYESIDEYAAVGGLYWTKGPEGQAMQYGTGEGIVDFRPQIPKVDKVQKCWGLGMGFTLFRIDLFKDPAIQQPWFRTVQEWSPEKGGRAYTQDLFFFENIARLGYKVACDSRVKVGHLDLSDGTVW